MAGFILVVVILTAAALADMGAPVERIDVDRMLPPLPENVAAYEASARGVALAY